MKLLILTRRLLIRSAFREKCIFIDYDQDYNKRVFVLHFFISLSDNLKLSIDIYQVCEACIRSASVHFCEALPFKTRRQKAHNVFFVL